MIAKKITFFIFGVVSASAWWQAAVFGHGNLAPLWAIAVVGTIFTLIVWGIQIENNWHD